MNTTQLNSSNDLYSQWYLRFIEIVKDKYKLERKEP